MDTRAFSMARNLRSYAGAGALVLLSVCGPGFAQPQDDELVLVPFSSLSSAAQQEILALKQAQNPVSVADPIGLSVNEPVTQQSAAPADGQFMMVDGRRVRINWAIGVYR